MGLSEADEPSRARAGQHSGVVAWYPAGEQAGTALGRDTGRVDIVLPTDRHPVERPLPHIAQLALARGRGLGVGTIGRDPGIDALGVRVRCDRLKIRLG